MRVTIEVQNRAEADAVKAAMENEEIRAFVIGAGALLQLPSDYARRRVIAFFDRPTVPPRNGRGPSDALRMVLDEANPGQSYSSGE